MIEKRRTIRIIPEGIAGALTSGELVLPGGRAGSLQVCKLLVTRLFEHVHARLSRLSRSAPRDPKSTPASMASSGMIETRSRVNDGKLRSRRLRT
eukprot:5761906-Prymnesium_polylepis.1